MDKYCRWINGGRAGGRVKGAEECDAGEGLQRADIDGGGEARLAPVLGEGETVGSLALLPPEISPETLNVCVG